MNKKGFTLIEMIVTIFIFTGILLIAIPAIMNQINDKKSEISDAMLNTIPMELTFIDENSVNKYFNDGDNMKLFKRPLMAIDREVFSCHPPKIEPMVRSIIEDFKNGSRDYVDVWNSRDDQPVLVKYMAVRDKENNYVGTLECVQPMGFAEKHFCK